MIIIDATFGAAVNLRAAGAAILRAIAVAQNLELFNPIDGWVHQDRSLRPDVVIVGTIDAPLVRIRGSAAERDVNAAHQPFALVVKTFSDGGAGHERGELHEVAAVERQF